MVVAPMLRVHPYRRPDIKIFPVTVVCARCKTIEEIDAEFEDGRMVRIVHTRHFTGYGGNVYCHCPGDGPAKVYLPHFLKF